MAVGKTSDANFESDVLKSVEPVVLIIHTLPLQ